MFSSYFKLKKDKDKYKDKAQDIYKRILTLSSNFTNLENYFKKKDFNTSFEVFSIFIIFYIKNLKELKLENYQNINQILIDLLIEDLDYSLREQGIGDMNIGKYVKKYVKKFYYRLSIIDKNLDNSNFDELSSFLKNLDFINNDHLDEFLKKSYSKYNEIKLELKNEFI